MSPLCFLAPPPVLVPVPHPHLARGARRHKASGTATVAAVGVALARRAVKTASIPTEIDGDACSPPWRANGVAQITDEILESAGEPDAVENMAGQQVRGCHKGAKQVATLGPASASDEMLERLFLCGVDTFRLNFSHGDHEEKSDLIERIRKLESKYRHPIGILADMQGPKQRCGVFADPEGVELKKGQRFRFDLLPEPGDATRVQLPHPEILQALTQGKQLLLDDGNIRMEILSKGHLLDGREVTDELAAKEEEATPFVDCTVTVPGRLKAKKGVNTPDVILEMSPITEKDKLDVEFACKAGVDWIAMSFVQKSSDMKELRKRVNDHGFYEIKLLAKIEKPSAVQDIAGILEASDGVMVARGDLGVEMPAEDVPFVQKRIIRAANDQGKPVIVATQMLESMIKNPTPTRAECSDIANAILDGCDAVMLSGESAVGLYPTKAVTMQRRVIERTQANQKALQEQAAFVTDTEDGTDQVLQSAATLAKTMNACAMVVFTATGRTAQLLAQKRPGVPILAVCKCLEVARRVSLLHGVYGTSDPDAQKLAARVEKENAYKVRFSEAVEIACRLCREKGIAEKDQDDVVLVSRLPLFDHGRLNTIRIVQASGAKEGDGYGPEMGED